MGVTYCHRDARSSAGLRSGQMGGITQTANDLDAAFYFLLLFVCTWYFQDGLGHIENADEMAVSCTS